MTFLCSGCCVDLGSLGIPRTLMEGELTTINQRVNTLKQDIEVAENQVTENVADVSEELWSGHPMPLITHGSFKAAMGAMLHTTEGRNMVQESLVSCNGIPYNTCMMSW